MMWCAAAGDGCWTELDTGELLSINGCVNLIESRGINSGMDDWFYLFTKQVGLDDDDEDEDQLKWMVSYPEARKRKRNSS